MSDNEPNIPAATESDAPTEATTAVEPATAGVKEQPTLILGAGPAGLTAGYLLAKQGLPVIVFEAEDQVGGIAKTEVRDGPGGEYRFDLGGHRFFTKVQEVDDLWHEIMREEFLKRPRMSRIYWNKKFLDYPLRGPDVIKKLGPIELTRCMLSYLVAKVKPKGEEKTFEQWVTNRFGKRLFDNFFRSYTEKVWGTPVSEIRADWAAQRIKGLSFFSAAKAAFFGNKDDEIKSLISEFNYPRYGPGQMWETMTDDIKRLGGEIHMNTPVEKLHVENGKVTKVIAGGKEYESNQVISSLPLRNVAGMIDPPPAPEVRSAAKGLRYRDFLTVSLVLDGEDLFPDNWIYIHEPEVEVGRIQNFRSWSPWMVPDPSKACVGLEYFCFAGDELWETSDEDLVKLGMTRAREARPGQARRCSSSASPRACRRPTRSTTWTTASGSRRSRAGSTASPTSSRSAATVCTATTTPTTPCSPRCARWTTWSRAPSTTCSRSTPSRRTTRRSPSRTSSPTSRRPRPKRREQPLHS